MQVFLWIFWFGDFAQRSQIQHILHALWNKQPNAVFASKKKEKSRIKGKWSTESETISVDFEKNEQI